MSKYQELGKAVSDAEAVIERLLFEGPEAYEAAVKQREAAEKALAAFEKRAAELMELAQEAIRETCRLCPFASHGCSRCERREECEGVKLLSEMEAL